jgi:hypothetical protein
MGAGCGMEKPMAMGAGTTGMAAGHNLLSLADRRRRADKNGKAPIASGQAAGRRVTFERGQGEEPGQAAGGWDRPSHAIGAEDGKAAPSGCALNASQIQEHTGAPSADGALYDPRVAMSVE